jgi:hypothetical protein
VTSNKKRFDNEKERAAEQSWENAYMELTGCTESQARNVFMYVGGDSASSETNQTNTEAQTQTS